MSSIPISLLDLKTTPRHAWWQTTTKKRKANGVPVAVTSAP